MMDPAMCDEVYVMNLLGHLKLAHERGLEGNEEYFFASGQLGGCDPIEHLGQELARDLICAPWTPGWPQDFRNLRVQLDAQFAADPGQAQPRRRATPSEVLSLLRDPALETLSSTAGVPIEAMFDTGNVARVAQRPQWGVPGDLPLADRVRAIVRMAPRLIGDADLLEWTVKRLFSREFRDALYETSGKDAKDFLRDLLIDPRRDDANLAEQEQVEFGYGLLTPLLSFAALDRRLARIQSRIVQAAQSTLFECERVSQGLRQVVELRVVSALQLQGGYRQAARLLFGEVVSNEDSEDDYDDDAEEFAQGLSDLQRVAAKLSAKRKRSSARRSSVRRVKDIEEQSQGQFHWEPVADSSPEVDGIVVEQERQAVQETQERRFLAGFRQRFLRAQDASDSPLRPVEGLVVRCQPSDVVLVRITGLNEEDQQLLEQRLPSAFASSSGDTLRERIRTSRLTTAWPTEPMVAETGQDASLQLLFARALEIMNPKPLSKHDGDLVASLADRETMTLQSGAGCGFTCPSLQTLIDEVT